MIISPARPLLVYLTTTRLRDWIALAKLKDTYGLPADLIWYHLRDRHPFVVADLSSERFEMELDWLIKVRQAIRSPDWPKSGHLAMARTL